MGRVYKLEQVEPRNDNLRVILKWDCKGCRLGPGTGVGGGGGYLQKMTCQ